MRAEINWGQVTPLPWEARSAQWYHHQSWHQQPGQGTGPPKARMPKGAPGAQHSACYFTVVLGCRTRNNSIWGQLRNADISTVLEANSGKQLSLEPRRSWGLGKLRMTGTPKGKSQNSSEEIVYNMHFLFLWQTWLVTSIQMQLCRGWSINNAKPRKERSTLIYSIPHAVLNNVMHQVLPSP